MEMRGIEDIAIGEDLTPPLRPLAAVLHDAAVASYCSACFSSLPQNSCHVPSNITSPLYCSPNCSSFDSSLHFSSAEPYLLSLFAQSPPSTWNNSADLRLSLRLVHIFRRQYSILPRILGSDRRLFFGGKNGCPFRKNETFEGLDDNLENMERIAGLMTNRDNLLFQDNLGNCDDSGESKEYFKERIREGAKMMAKARRMCMDGGLIVNVVNEEEFALEEMVLCLVITNAVEVQDKSGSSIGIAVYDTAFSWINHSCSPNGCYRFLLGTDSIGQPSLLRITPAGGCADGDDNGSMMGSDLKFQVSEVNGYGPRVIVRSIKAVNKGEEVTIAYTDLLQPKDMRQAELWLKYRFRCSCKRCAAVPTNYVDNALQALPVCRPDSENEIEKLMQEFDDAISDYLSFDNPKSCCEKLENLLCFDESPEPKKAKSSLKVKLYPFHHLALNAYTTLASAYKVQASDILSFNYEVEGRKLEAFNMYMKSSAYSLLLAGVVNHLFMFESALVTTVSNFWINAGESLMNLARCPFWDSFLKQEPIQMELSSLSTLECSDCSLTHTLEPTSHSPDQKMQLEEIKGRLYNCIANISPKVWRKLSSQSCFLKSIQNPIDLGWLGKIQDIEPRLAMSEEYGGQLRMNLVLLSIHCLRYGALLSSICYGFYSSEPKCLEVRSAAFFGAI